MLVLTRQVGESIMIADNIRVTVVDIDRNRVRLGFEAPKDIPIKRSELLQMKIVDIELDSDVGEIVFDAESEDDQAQKRQAG